jgi:glutamyl-tRNA reductase
MCVVSIGVDHRTAPVEIREALAFDREQALNFLTETAGHLPERFLLSTCNRTELLAVPAEGEADPAAKLLALLNRARGVTEIGTNGFTKIYRGEEAIRHLFRVAAGLESMVLGESQILGQVKDAGELAERCQASGPVLRKLLEWAVRVGKRARTETRIGEGAVSVASAAIELARKVFGDLGNREALVIGAGETGALVARHLRSASIGRLVVANRTLERAQGLAEEVGAEPWGLCGVPPGLRSADVVICSTGGDRPLITHEEVRLAMRARKDRMLLLLDISVPRAVEAKVDGIDSVFLHDIDALESIVDRNLEVRRRAVPKVEEIVAESVAAFLAWEREMEVVPTIKALREKFEELRRRELDQNLRRIPEEAREATIRLTESLLKKLLHEPTVTLRRASREPGGGRDLSAALRELFGIRDDDPTET